MISASIPSSMIVSGRRASLDIHGARPSGTSRIAAVARWNAATYPDTAQMLTTRPTTAAVPAPVALSIASISAGPSASSGSGSTTVTIRRITCWTPSDRAKIPTRATSTAAPGTIASSAK